MLSVSRPAAELRAGDSGRTLSLSNGGDAEGVQCSALAAVRDACSEDRARQHGVWVAEATSLVLLIKSMSPSPGFGI